MNSRRVIYDKTVKKSQFVHSFYLIVFKIKFCAKNVPSFQRIGPARLQVLIISVE